MQTKRHFWRALLSAATLLTTVPAFATLISYEYEGNVASFDGSGSILPSNFATGDLISGVFSYNDDVSGTTSSRSGYYQQSGITELSAIGSDVAFERGSSYRAQTTVIAGLVNRLEFLTFNPLHTGLALPMAGQRISSMTMVFRDVTATALSSLALPSAIDFADWSSVTLRVQAATPANRVDGHMFVDITRVAATGDNTFTVPEPGTIALLSLGFLALALRYRRKESISTINDQEPTSRIF